MIDTIPVKDSTPGMTVLWRSYDALLDCPDGADDGSDCKSVHWMTMGGILSMKHSGQNSTED